MTTHFATRAVESTGRTVAVLDRYLPGTVRVLLGLLFLFSGTFGLLMACGVVAMPQPSTPQPEAATAFMLGLMKAGYLFPLIKIVEVVAGACLLSNRLVPFALVLLAPLVVNILAVHAFLLPSGLVTAVLVFIAEGYLAWVHRDVYRPLFALRARA